MERLSSVTQRHTRLQQASFFLTAICLILLLSACGGNGANTSTSSSAATCDKSTGLTLYSAQGYDSDIAKAFQAQTGITTKLVDDSTGNLLAKIAAEGNNPHWDVTWFDGNVTMQSLDDQGLLLKWHAQNASNLTTQGAKYVPSDGSYYPAGLTTVGAIAYNTNHIPAAGLPKDWNDLLNPAYKILFDVTAPALTYPPYPFVAVVP